MNEMMQDQQDLIAQWAFDTRPLLGRFHLWLDDVEVRWLSGEPAKEFTREISFLDGRMERLFAMGAAVTALGTQLFGRFGEGAKLDKAGLNQVKKDADAISAYALSESLWYLTRQLPENHAIMVCMGEGLMPKAGETPEMGSNPQLGFGRVYARPEVARWLDQRVVRMLNDPAYRWEDFYGEIKARGITVWGAAIDTLENTSRFAKGSPNGALTVLHLFNQPLRVSRPYEGYVGNLFLPREIVARAALESLLITFRTDRALVVRAIEQCYPGIKREHIHVWTLRGKSREPRIGELWRQWAAQGVHIIDDGFGLPSGLAAFTESGTYAPTYRVGTWRDAGGDIHLFLVDGYAASAEAIQAASLAPMLDLEASLVPFTSRFDLPYQREQDVMSLNPDADDFKAKLEAVIGRTADAAAVQEFRRLIHEGIDAGIPVHKPLIHVDDFFPEKEWDVLAVCGYMQTDPYSGAPGVKQIETNVFRSSVRLAAPRGDKLITFTLRMMETPNQSRLVFNPLLNRFLAGEDYETRPVKISDSGRIRNELQTLCTEALEFCGDEHIRIHFDRILPEVIPEPKQAKLLEVLRWYKRRHPLWFSWLEIVEPTTHIG